jgi:hypothetical protein
MIEIHKFIADDGTEFSNEYDCLEYERNQSTQEFKNRIVALNEWGKRSAITDIASHLYLYIADEEAYNFYNHLCEDNSYITLDTETKYGFFYFDGDMDEWMNLVDWVDSILGHKDIIVKAIDEIVASGEKIENC